MLQQSIEISPYPGQRLSVEPYNPPDAYDGAPVTTNKPCSGLSSFIVVKEIPLNTADYSIKLYIDKLHGSEVCMDPQFNPEAGIAVIELKESIGKNFVYIFYNGFKIQFTQVYKILLYLCI